MPEHASFGIHQAVTELAALYEGQWANGLLPHIRFVPGQSGYRPDSQDWGVTPAIAGQDRVVTSGITQPPIMGLCTYDVFRRLPDPAAYLTDFLSFTHSLERFHHFLLAERDPTGENLAVCLHPWETGTDNSPAFEPLLEHTRRYLADHHIAIDHFGRADTVHVAREHRPTDKDYTAYFGLMALFKSAAYDQAPIAAQTPFLLQDVLFNTVLVASLEALAGLEDDLATLLEPGKPDSQHGQAAELRRRASENRTRSGQVAAAIRDHLWSEADGLFYARDARRGTLLPVPTVSSLMPLLGGIATPAQAERLSAHLLDPARYAAPYPVPSIAIDHPVFDPLRYWAGPSWPVPNWLLVRALAGSRPDVSDHLRQRTLAMIAEGEGDQARWAERAAQVMQANRVGRATTPSRGQYQHAWLWDSAIAAVGWAYIPEAPAPLATGEAGPGFWEYYHPLTGQPLGAPLMTWTAAVFLDLLDHSYRDSPA